MATSLRQSISGLVKRSGGVLPAPSPPQTWELPELWGSALLAHRAASQKQRLPGRHLRCQGHVVCFVFLFVLADVLLAHATLLLDSLAKQPSGRQVCSLAPGAGQSLAAEATVILEVSSLLHKLGPNACSESIHNVSL